MLAILDIFAFYGVLFFVVDILFFHVAAVWQQKDLSVVAIFVAHLFQFRVHRPKFFATVEGFGNVFHHEGGEEFAFCFFQKIFLKLAVKGDDDWNVPLFCHFDCCFCDGERTVQMDDVKIVIQHLLEMAVKGGSGCDIVAKINRQIFAAANFVWEIVHIFFVGAFRNKNGDVVLFGQDFGIVVKHIDDSIHHWEK